MNAIEVTDTVPLVASDAFDRFVALDDWWPREYTWAGLVLERVEMEAGEGGHCIEWGPHDFRCDWGRVLVWEPPYRLVFSWQIGPDRTPQPDPRRASRVEVRFDPVDDGTRITVTHDQFGRHGDSGEGYRDALAAEGGWPYMLRSFVNSVRSIPHR